MGIGEKGRKTPMGSKLESTLSKIKPLNQEAMECIEAELAQKLKPPGSLGKLEDLAIQLGGIYGLPLPELRKKVIVLMAADHGVFAEGFNHYPQEYSRILAELAGPGLLGVSVLAKQAGAQLVVVDVGLRGEVAGEHILRKKIRAGTANMATEAAMSRDEALQAIETGIEITESQLAQGMQVIGLGEVGICNTTSSAAVLAALTGKNPEELVGQGTGADEESYRQKLQAVRQALTVNQPDSADAIDVLAKVGGLEIAALTGCCLAAAAARKPIVLDGFITAAAALAAVRLHPLVRDYLIPSHLSAEKGGGVALQALDLEPLLLMKMRLGEGTGAALAFNFLEAACKIYQEMGSFADIPMEIFRV